MRPIPKVFTFLLAFSIAAALAACGSGDAPDPGAIRYTRQVVFGDSLSDVGTYAVGAIGEAGGGRYTINGDIGRHDPALTGRIWIEALAWEAGWSEPCAAQTGLSGNAAYGAPVPVQDHLDCFDYAQGGARVTDPIGPENPAAGSPVGGMTVPVARQVANHLARTGGRFSGDEIVFVMAGGNDALALLDELEAGAGAAEQIGGPAAAAAYVAANAPRAVERMAAAGAELAAIVTRAIVGNGASRVVVNNLPDLGNAPAATARDAATRQLILAMVEAFNHTLRAGLGSSERILYVDALALSRDQILRPEAYGIVNSTVPACAVNALASSSLVCTVDTLAWIDAAHYMFADDVHPTPYVHALFARHVAQQMMQRGWL